MSVLGSLRLRWRRKRFLARAWLRRRDLRAVADRTASIRPGAILALTTLRNERVRLPYFLSYYRDQGVDHFLMVDNASEIRQPHPFVAQCGQGEDRARSDAGGAVGHRTQVATAQPGTREKALAPPPQTKGTENAQTTTLRR